MSDAKRARRESSVSGKKRREEHKDEEEREEADDGGGEVAKSCLHTVYVLPEGPSRSRGSGLTRCESGRHGLRIVFMAFVARVARHAIGTAPSQRLCFARRLFRVKSLTRSPNARSRRDACSFLVCLQKRDRFQNPRRNASLKRRDNNNN